MDVPEIELGASVGHHDHPVVHSKVRTTKHSQWRFRSGQGGHATKHAVGKHHTWSWPQQDQAWSGFLPPMAVRCEQGARPNDLHPADRTGSGSETSCRVRWVVYRLVLQHPTTAPNSHPCWYRLPPIRWVRWQPPARATLSAPKRQTTSPPRRARPNVWPVSANPSLRNRSLCQWCWWPEAFAAPPGAVALTGNVSACSLSLPCASLNTSVTGTVVSLSRGCFRSISITW